MFQRATVFIIGAGCSMEYGFPNSTGLRQQIMDKLSSPNSVIHGTIGAAYAYNSGLTAIDLQKDIAYLSRGLPYKPSIDQYLELHADKPSLIRLGKILIASTVLDDENAHISKLDPTTDHYLTPLSHGMSDKLDIRHPVEMFDNITFITFNYDRVIEKFIENSLWNVVGDMLPDAFGETMKGLRVIHVYGQVGRLPAHRANRITASLEEVAYGGRSGTQIIPYDALATVSEGLRTFSEGYEDSLRDRDIKNALGNAEQIVISGLSYLEENLRVLTHRAPRVRKVLMTTMGLSQPDQDQAKIDVVSALHLGIRASGALSPENFQVNATKLMWDWIQTLRR